MPDKEDSVEAQLAVINYKLDVLIESRHDQESRIRSLEQFKWLFMGAAITSGAASGGIVAKLLG